MIFDSHAHLNFKAFSEDIAEVISRCQKKKMLVLNVGSQLVTSQRAVEIARNNSNFFASVGIHPIHIWGENLDEHEQAAKKEMGKMEPEEMFNEIAKLAKDSKVVAIGETGIDYFHIEKELETVKKLQKKFFKMHLALAEELNKPLVLHARASASEDAYWDILEILKEKEYLPLSEKKGVIHCFGSNLEIANEFISLGFAIGFTGIITFKKKAENLQMVAKNIPLENILIETDSPYLAPEPYRGKRNEPIYVEEVAKKISELKGVPIGQVIEGTTNNAKEIFKIII